MANEARVSLSLSINKDNLLANLVESFSATIENGKGPSPGAISVTTSGTDISFAELTTPGLVLLKNLSESDYVEYGIREPATTTFYPMGELLPGESALFRFSRNLLEEYFPSTGTGTSGPTNFFHMKADTATCWVQVFAFES